VTLTPPTHAARLSYDERSQLSMELLLQAADAREAGDDETRDRLLDKVVVINLRVASAIAARYQNRGVALEDLEQVAFEGLVKAVRRFDPSRRSDLLSYAVPTIRGEVRRYFRDSSWTIRPPRRLMDLQWRINRTIDTMSQELGREPTDAEVADRLGLCAEEYDEALLAFGCFAPPSLEQPLAGAADLTLGDSLADLDGPAEAEEAAEARSMLLPLLHRLPENDRRLLGLRFIEDRTQREIGEMYGVTQVQVSRWLARICNRLREQLESGTPDTDVA
jgi:RNA polymerase sigma-B factor